ncbi:Pyrimidine 5'-nucleotidase YjjG [Anaerolineae bacterium]|nr:Pyrimidine 5'-nucleotidase YjjG [Anaerolineae bacterium]
MPIRAIIFDVGDVILHEHDHTKRTEWEKRLGLAPGQLNRIVQGCEPAPYAAALGQVSEREIWETVAVRLHLDDAQIPELQRDFWSSEQLDTTLVQFIQSLRPKYKIGILSNAWSDARYFHNTKFKMNTWVDAAVYSAEVKLLKPDPRIYQLILDQLELPANECVFVDDKLVNVQAAQALGMKGVLCRETQQTIDDIRACLDERHALAALFFDLGDTIMDEATEVKDETETTQRAELIPGMAEVLRLLKSQGHRLAIVADARPNTPINVLKQHGLLELFDYLAVSDCIGAEKPHPQIFQAAFDALHISSHDYARVVMVGNNLERDIVGANLLGMISIFYHWNERRRTQPLTPEEQPRYTITSPSELLALIERLDK